MFANNKKKTSFSFRSRKCFRTKRLKLMKRLVSLTTRHFCQSISNGNVSLLCRYAFIALIVMPLCSYVEITSGEIAKLPTDRTFLFVRKSIYLKLLAKNVCFGFYAKNANMQKLSNFNYDKKKKTFLFTRKNS